MGFDGVARSELSCQPMVLSDPEADLQDSVQEETETRESKWPVKVTQQLGAKAEIKSHDKGLYSWVFLILL